MSEANQPPIADPPPQNPKQDPEPEPNPRKQSQDDARKEVDSRSIFVKMHFDTKKEELEAVFEDCGKIEKVTILTQNGRSKGNAYVAFDSTDAVQHALMLSGTKIRNREIKVNPKRTNKKGMGRHSRQANEPGNYLNLLLKSNFTF